MENKKECLDEIVELSCIVYARLTEIAGKHSCPESNTTIEFEKVLETLLSWLGTGWIVQWDGVQYTKKEGEKNGI